MFTTITVTTSQDTTGRQYTSVRRYDNHGKVAGTGRIYQTGNAGRVYSAIRSMGFHFMHRTATGATFGKLIA